ncbi:MAG TPA: M3 family metallopeptidase [Casimicrobiaceae bacterium]|jgi:oligopeptidase A|nr:M3 family metallopeptidase [Casimicrobiaceae bacterium]
MNAPQPPLASNPLLDFSGLPRFGEIAPEHVGPAVDALLADARARIEQVATSAATPTWDGFVLPLAAAQDRLDQAWSQVVHLNAVVNTPALREAYSASLPKVTAFHAEFGQDERLFAGFRALAATAAFDRFEPGRRRAIENELRDFRLGGAELAVDDKARLKQIDEELAGLSARFEDNLLDATNDYAFCTEDGAELAGVPADVLAAAREAAAQDGRSGWKLTLRMPCYQPVLQYADSRSLRESLYRAYAVRASEFGNPAWDNTALIQRLLKLRLDAARLLGYRNFAEVSLVPKMARTPEEVLAFLDSLVARAKPYAERDMAELRSFSSAELGLPELAAWDLPYASEKLRQARYSFSDQEVKQYFPEERVLAGMYRVAETVFGIHIRESRAAAWHPAVRFFDVFDAAGTLIGQFYLDLYARQNKRGGAWMEHAINRRRYATGTQHPVAYLVCNFSAPVTRDGQPRPALFTHDEVQTLFHEFGHGLHLLLTRVDVPGVSGLEGVEWDAVEMPSQFMENFCWEWEVLRQMTGHVATGESLPRALFERMLAAKNFQVGLQMIRQLEFALFDMRLHFDFVPASSQSTLELARAIRRQVAVVPRPDYDRAANAFTHIFAGGYAAGYYSYKWAEVLSADAYSLFEEKGVLSAEAGARFRDEVLAQGGSRPALESFVAFRGRPPQIDALLRHNGMSAS